MYGHARVFFLGILLYVFHNSYGINRPLVETSAGLVRGLRDDDDSYSMFMGIPYATVDENNAFGPAIPHPTFEGVLDAYDDSAMCPQIEEFNNTITGSLDCLHLNIYVPDSATPTNKLPVLVWIYGGGFNYGFAGRYLYGPKYLVRHDIILVTLNYRVGPYGFMCLDTPEVPGNAGIKDQIIALEWINKNIEAFGGDPGKVTIYGMSAGGVAVDILYMYADHNLFDKLILYSGTAMIPWTIGNQDVKSAIKLANDLGLATNDTSEAIKFLSTVDPLLVIESNSRLSLSYSLCVEKEFPGVKRLIHEHPVNMIGPDASNKSVILGYNRDEFHLSYARTPAENFPGLSNVFRNYLLNYFNFEADELKLLETIVRRFYMGDESFTENIRESLGNHRSDIDVNYPTFRSIKRFVENGCRNVYHYVFSYDGERNFVKVKINITHLDIVVHADEVGYVFDISYMDTPSARDQLAIDRMTTLWANFVKYGNPTPQPTELLPVTWGAATLDTIPYLELDSEVRVGKRHYHDRVAFWELFYELNGEKEYGYKANEASIVGQLKYVFLLTAFLLAIY